MTENYRGDLMKVVREGLSEKVTVKLRTERFEGASHVKGLGGGGSCRQREHYV